MIKLKYLLAFLLIGSFSIILTGCLVGVPDVGHAVRVFERNEDKFISISAILFEMYDEKGRIPTNEERLENEELNGLTEKLMETIISIRFVDPDVILFTTDAPFQAVRGIAITRNDFEHEPRTIWGIQGLAFSRVDDNIYRFSGGN